MAIVRGKKPATKKTEDVIMGQDTITVKVRKGTEYSKEAIEIGRTISITEDDDANDKIAELIGELDGIAEEYISQYAAEGGYDETPEEQVEEPDEPEDANAEIDEDTIREMGKVELKKFIKENDIDIDPADYKKLDDLKDAVITALAGEESSEEVEGAEVDEDAIREMDRKELTELIEEQELDVNPKDYKKIADLAEAVIEALGSASQESVDELDEETIRAMDRKELIEFIKENDLGVNPKEYKKLSDLADAVIEQMSEPGTDLTSDDVLEMDRDALVALIEEQELDLNPKKYKKTADLAEAVIGLLFSEEGGFDSTDFEEE